MARSRPRPAQWRRMPARVHVLVTLRGVHRGAGGWQPTSLSHAAAGPCRPGRGVGGGRGVGSGWWLFGAIESNRVERPVGPTLSGPRLLCRCLVRLDRSSTARAPVRHAALSGEREVLIRSRRVRPTKPFAFQRPVKYVWHSKKVRHQNCSGQNNVYQSIM